MRHAADILFLTLAGCGGVEQTTTTSCGQTVASYCATQQGGCPATDSWQAICDWGTARGALPLAGGGPVECRSGLHGFDVDQSGVVRTYLFLRSDELAAVLEHPSTTPAERCLAGALPAQDDCTSSDVAYGCTAVAPQDGAAD